MIISGKFLSRVRAGVLDIRRIDEVGWSGDARCILSYAKKAGPPASRKDDS
jgi:hypothetical protein